MKSHRKEHEINEKKVAQYMERNPNVLFTYMNKATSKMIRDGRRV